MLPFWSHRSLVLCLSFGRLYYAWVLPLRIASSPSLCLHLVWTPLGFVCDQGLCKPSCCFNERLWVSPFLWLFLPSTGRLSSVLGASEFLRICTFPFVHPAAISLASNPQLQAVVCRLFGSKLVETALLPEAWMPVHRGEKELDLVVAGMERDEKGKRPGTLVHSGV